MKTGWRLELQKRVRCISVLAIFMYRLIELYKFVRLIQTNLVNNREKFRDKTLSFSEKLQFSSFQPHPIQTSDTVKLHYRNELYTSYFFSSFTMTFCT